MKHIDEIRRENMGKLRDKFGGVSGLAKKLERSDAQVSQWIKGATHSVTGKPRGMKSDTARWIEVICNIPEGWLDQNHDANEMIKDIESINKFPVKPASSRALVQRICDLSEQIDDNGLRELAGFALCLTGTHPLVKAKRA